MDREERAWKGLFLASVARASGRKCEVVVGQEKEERSQRSENGSLYSQKFRVQHDGLEQATESCLAGNIIE